MTADIINLADCRQARSSRVDKAASQGSAFQMAARLRGFGISPAARRPMTNEEHSAYCCEQIQRIADNLGIDIEAPFRAKPTAAPPDKRATKPRRSPRRRPS